MTDWIKTAKVGDKVVCIQATARKVNDLGMPGFVAGQVLTIRAIEFFDARGALPQAEPFLSFMECDPRHYGHYEGFRPVQRRPTDISIFTDMLKGEPVKQREDA